MAMNPFKLSYISIMAANGLAARVAGYLAGVLAGGGAGVSQYKDTVLPA